MIKKEKRKKRRRKQLGNEPPTTNSFFIYTDKTSNKDDESNITLRNTTLVDKSTACYFREFGDFWPYLAHSKVNELAKNQRFCFMLSHPEFLKTGNRIFVENIIKKLNSKKFDVHEIVNQSSSVETGCIENEDEKKEDMEFQKVKAMISNICPNYYLYLEMYYKKNLLYSFERKKDKMFKEAIVNCSKKAEKNLQELERTFGRFIRIFSTIYE